MKISHLKKTFRQLSCFASFSVLFFTASQASWANTQSQQDSNNIQVTRQTGTQTSSAYEDPGVNPFDELEKVQTGLNKAVRESWKRMKNYQQAGKFFEPDADFIEKGSNYILKMDLPGMAKDQINIDASNNRITISGERNTERQTQESNTGVYQFERSSGSFYRSLSLPANANTDQIAAKYENGVLEVTIPKLKSQASAAKKIAIQ